MNYLCEGDIIELTKRVRAHQIEELEFGEMQELEDSQTAYHDYSKRLWYWEPGTKFIVQQDEYFDANKPLKFYVKLVNPDYFYGHIEGYMDFDRETIKIVKSVGCDM